MIRAIYFDYHGVLDRRDYHGLIQTIAKTAGLATIPTDLEPLVYDYATGLSSPSSFWSTIQHQYGTEAASAGTKYYLHVDPIRKCWRMLNQLHGRVWLGMCSDCALDKKEAIRHAYDLPTFFDDLLFSCDVRVTKREPAFYRFLEQRGHFQPNEILLIDNNPTNIQIVGRLGMGGYVYTTPEGLRQTLGLAEPAFEA